MEGETEKPVKPGTFKKGYDPRRKPRSKGTMRTFKELRDIAQGIANETGEDGQLLVDKILRTWATSNNPFLAKEFLQIAYGKAPDAPVEEPRGIANQISIPAELIADKFLPVYRDLIAGKHTEYVLFGGRGSTKSSFASLAFIVLLLNNPTLSLIHI